MNIDYKPRFSFEISEELRMRADRILDTYGQRKALFVPILEDVLDLIEEHGGLAIGIIMAKKLKPRDVLPTLKKVEDTANVRS